MVEDVISGMRIQPHIHDVIVGVRRGQHVHYFNIFLKNHRFLPVNHTILTLFPGRSWNGDILVMKMGKAVPGVVNMRHDDAWLADFAVRR